MLPGSDAVGFQPYRYRQTILVGHREIADTKRRTGQTPYKEQHAETGQTREV
jgi:hypothetical protein